MKKVIALSDWIFKIKQLVLEPTEFFTTANTVRKDEVYKLDPFTAAECMLAYEVEKRVSLPHTWSVDPDKKIQHYTGLATYETEVRLSDCQDKVVILYVGCAYHTANVYINGHLAGDHTGCGYLPFEIDISDFIKDGINHIRIDVDNTPSKQVLPHNLDFDWADDGGLTRNVALHIFEESDIFGADISYEMAVDANEVCHGSVFIDVDACDQKIIAELVDVETNTVIATAKGESHQLFVLSFEEAKCWSPECPALYIVRLQGESSVYEKRIGFRLIETRGTGVYLNDRPIYLKGCEWMPGSHPEYGTAEPFAISEKFLSLLKEAGCNFTRFHWQQDDTFYDWCDEHGLMVQEEIPYWGYPKKATPLQLRIAKEQACDMVYYHGHHPSIVCWGVGNELGGEESQTIDYVDQMVAFFKEADDSRLVNYVSNSMSQDHLVDKDDATMHGDIAMWNEYLGLWQPCDDIEGVIKRTNRKAGNMPVVVSEFGLCEPAFAGGDKTRCEILKERLPIYARIENMAGYVYFCLNDYRTQMGEEGTGRERKRVHGSTDVKGNKKPSYELFKELQREYNQ